VHTTLPLAPQEKLALTPGGVRSSVYGSLAFQTPIAEIEMDHVTEQEAELYRQWLRVYEIRWRDAFDPIAARIMLGEGEAALDLSVMPLIGSSRYRWLVDIARGVSIESGATDRHAGTLVHVALAVNKQSSTALMGAGMLSAAARSQAPEIQLDPLGWMDETVALYVDDSPLWDELAEAEDPVTFLGEHLYRLPVALHFDVTSGFKLVAFLGALRGFIEQTAPGMTRWESRTHNGIDYVRVTPSEQAMAEGDDLADASVYYAASGQALIVSFDEEVLRRALDRQAGTGAAGQGVRQWLGKQLGVQLDKTFLESVEPALSAQAGPLMQFAAWSNLAILNEWTRLYPGRDPLEIHERFWQRRLRCPGGGTYHWDERWQTMTSTVYGHPGSPREGPTLPEALGRISGLNAGLTFEHDGLRARVELHERPAWP
jgi:hypothetical protein